jgi:hypothetical protein
LVLVVMVAPKVTVVTRATSAIKESLVHAAIKAHQGSTVQRDWSVRMVLLD